MFGVLVRALTFSATIIRAMFIPAVLILLAVSPEWLPLCLKELSASLTSAFTRENEF